MASAVALHAQHHASAQLVSSPASPDAAQLGEGGEGLFLDRYIIEKQLGEGSYGKVKLAIDTEMNRKVALKIIHKTTIKKPEHITRIKREVRIMRLLNHPSIVKLFDVAETDKDIVLAMEFVEGGELFDFIVAQNRLNDKTARRIFRQIVSAVDYCHQSSIIHRDLKPENLLMDLHRNIKIIDFGFVNLFDPEDTLKTFCGSPFYASPEMILGRQYVGPEVDIWSMGVILYALLTGQLPFRDVNTKDLYKKITTSTFEIPSYVPEDASMLIRRMLCVDPAARATLEQIRLHPWVNRGFDHPPDSMIPWRQKLVEPLDEKVLETMRLYGYDQAAARQAILASPDKGPAFSLYWLLKEQEDSMQIAKKSQYLTPSTLHRQGSVALTASSLQVPATSSDGLEGGLVKKNTIKRRKSISGAIRQNPIPARSALAVDDKWNDPSVSESAEERQPAPSLKARTISTHVEGSSLVPEPHAHSSHKIRPPGGAASRLSVNVESPVSGSNEDELALPPSPMQNPNSQVSRRRSVSAVNSSYANNLAKPRRRMTEHASMASSSNTANTSKRPSAVESNLIPGTSHHSSRRSSFQAGASEDTVPEMVSLGNASQVTSAATSARSSSYQPRPPSNAVHPGGGNPTGAEKERELTSATGTGTTTPGAGNDKIKRRISISNFGSALTSAFSKMRPSSSSSRKRESSVTSATSPTSAAAPAPRISKAMYAADTTSTKQPDAIVAELTRAFGETGIQAEWQGFKATCEAQSVQFTIEVCQIKGTQMCGLELRRQKGSTWTYQIVCRTLIGNLRL
ncbi:MAP/microtubule affinity-regulating kinase 3 [Phlyctochytrium bullatum]|nr:MAP/microtubule affinity-regulating kinase 3 [Phlyctochytrium bullatum]